MPETKDAECKDHPGWGVEAHTELQQQMAAGVGDCTAAGAAFFASHMQLLGFVNFVASLPKHVDASLDGFSKILDKEKEEPPSTVFQRGFDPFRPLVAEVLLTRAVDSYLTYISELLALVFREKPRTLLSGDKVEVRYALAFESQEELREAIAEREVRRLAYLGMPELSKWFKDTLGFDLVPNRERRQEITRQVERRNLLTHHRGVIDHRFIDKCGRGEGAVGEKINVKEAGAQGYALLAEVVWDADERAAEKWSLERSPLVTEDRAGDQLSLAREAEPSQSDAPTLMRSSVGSPGGPSEDRHRT